MRLRILLSYWYYKDTDLDALFAKYFAKPYPDVFADSGGFSAWSQGVAISWQAYAAWLKRWGHLFTACANLDVIGDHEATMANQRKLEGVGLVPIPVFHIGSRYEDLEALVDEYRYIALGGLVPYMRYLDKVMPHLVKCFKLAGERAVYHGFGVTSWEILKVLPWYSVDSSSWGQGFRYGQVPIFDGRRGRFLKLSLGDKAQWQKHAALVREMGFDPLDFADRERNDRAKICAISALSYMRAEQWLRELHGEVRIPGDEDAPAGLRAHLVTGADGDGSGDSKGGNMSVAALGQAGAGGDRLHLSDTSNGVNFSDADKGLKLHLTDARGHSGGEIAAAESGLKLHLSEHSLDRGGVGDTSRAMDVLNET